MNKFKYGIMGAVIGVVTLGTIVGIKYSCNKVVENDVPRLDQIEQVTAEKEEFILYEGKTADLAVDYSKVENLLKESALVAIVNVETEEGKNYNPNREQYVPVYTTGKLKIEKVLLDKDSGIDINNSIDYVRLGGNIQYSEYLKGLLEVQRTKLERNVASDEKLNGVDKDKIIVNSKLLEDIMVESNKEYVVFLKFSNDYQKYNIFGFQYGLREYDKETNTIKNNETGEFESLDSLIEQLN